MKLHHLPTLCAALLVLSAGPAAAQTTAVPNFISYQGTVVDAGGLKVGAVTPVNRTVIFRIWDHPSSTAIANLKYSESQVVTISEGEFSVLVGQGVANPTTTFGYSEATKFTNLAGAFDGSDRYLGVTVAAAAAIVAGDNEISPRQQIVSTAFAMRAKFAESIGSSSDLALTPLTGSASNYGLGWYGAGRLFNNTAVDGPVLYGNAGGALGSNASGTQNTALRWDASGRVGISNTSPATTLEVGSTTKQSDSFIRVSTAGGNLYRAGIDFRHFSPDLGYSIYSDERAGGPQGLHFSRALGGTISTKMFLSPAGNIGIGTTGPSVALDVTGAIKASTSIAAGTTIAAGNSIAANGNYGHVFTGTGDADGGLFSPADGTVTIRTNSIERLRVNSVGNVGIGTTTPNFPLTLSNNLGDKIALNINGSTGLCYGLGIQNNLFQIHTDQSTSDIAFGYGSSAAMTETMRIKGTGAVSIPGNVGIGTATPTRAKLEVLGFVNTAVPAGYAHFSTGVGGVPAATRAVSIYSDKVIWANDWIVASSDERIKTISGVSDGASDLRALMGVNVTNYTYKDVIGKGNAPQKKLVAQQVEKVFPMAVSQQTDVVPDIYKQATIQDGWVELATDLKKGERVKLITDKDEGSVHEVLEVLVGKFRTDFKPVGDKVFVFGREVNDFRTVDYDAIAMLNVSATQQLKREKDAEIQALRDENTTLRRELAAKDVSLEARLIALGDENAALRRELAAKDASLEARLIALERRVSEGTGTETISLKSTQAAK